MVVNLRGVSEARVGRGGRAAKKIMQGILENVESGYAMGKMGIDLSGDRWRNMQNVPQQCPY